jgi:hypothetical protein
VRQLEHQTQCALFTWAQSMQSQYPELALLHAIPNGGQRNAIVGAKLKREGVKRGIPDVHLPVARGPYVGLWIEHKAGKNKLSPDQEHIKHFLEVELNRVIVSYDWTHSARAIEEYLKLPRPRIKGK